MVLGESKQSFLNLMSMYCGEIVRESVVYPQQVFLEINLAPNCHSQNNLNCKILRHLHLMFLSWFALLNLSEMNQNLISTRQLQ